MMLRAATAAILVVMMPLVGHAQQQQYQIQQTPYPQVQQSNTSHPQVSSMIPESAADTVYAYIEAITPQSREVTLAAANGRTIRVLADQKIALDQFGVGDWVAAHYYRSVGFYISRGGPQQLHDPRNLSSDEAGLLAGHAHARTPHGMDVEVGQVIGQVVGIRNEARTLDIINPTGGGVYTIQVSDNPQRMDVARSLKVGDIVTAVISPNIADWIERARTPTWSGGGG